MILTDLSRPGDRPTPAAPGFFPSPGSNWHRLGEVVGVGCRPKTEGFEKHMLRHGV